MTSIKRYPAQISFVQAANNEHVWIGRLVNREQAIDTVTGCRATELRIKILITQEDESWFTLTVQGNGPSSSRHFRHKDCSAAQTQAIAWAGRRFKIPVEV